MATSKKSITARMRERCQGYATVCVVPTDDMREAVDLLTTLQASLKELAYQISVIAPRDEFGHDFRMNDAYVKAMELLGRLDTA